LTQITDGTSNTWMVGEQSQHLLDPNKNPITVGFTSGVGNSAGIYGWTMGAAIGQNQNPANWGDGRCFNTTAVRYQINQIGIVPAGTNGAAAAAAAAGVCNDDGMNFPLSSNHSGGVNTLFGDATVHFAANSMATATISALATRNGNEIVTFDQ
jgi:hypothetical protein